MEAVTTVLAARTLHAVKLSERVKFAWERSGLSKRALSDAAGKSPDYVQKLIERDAKRPDIVALAKIAELAKVSEAWLIHGRGNHNDPSTSTTALRTDDGRVRYVDLANWPELLASARLEEPDMPEWVWEKLATMRFELDAAPTHLTVAEAAVWVRRHERLYKPRPARAETGPHQAQPGPTGTGGDS